MAIYLITGGCGFIGSHLADAVIARGDQVRILDDLSTGKRDNPLSGCELIVGDVTDAKTVAKAMAGVEGCWHMAAVASVARSNEAWVETHRVNLTGTIQVLDAARRFGRGGPVPVVYASSASVFGDNVQIPLAETDPARPLSAYGADKLASELHARVGTLVHGVPTVGFRFFNVYGTRQDPKSPYSGVITIFVDRIRSGDPILIQGDGQQTRDFVFVGDVVRFLLVGMERRREQPELFNVCTGRQTAIVDLAESLFRVCGRRVPLRYMPARVGDVRFSEGDPSRGIADLGLAAQTGLDEGLALTFSHI